MTEDKCLCEPTEFLIFPCSGGSNVGQIANDAAKKLTTQGVGKMYCLAGLGGHVSGLIESTKAAKRIIVIDGCPVHCAKKTVEHAGFKPDVHVVVTDLGIQKRLDFKIENDEIKKVTDEVSKKLRK